MGGIAGGGEGGGGGGGYQAQPTTTTQTTEPWAEQRGYLTRGFSLASGQVGDIPRQFFPGSTVIPFSPETQQALEMTKARALAGSPLQKDATDELSKTLRGDYLYGGQGFNEAIDAAKRRVLPSVDSQFALGGRYGSGLAQEAQAKAVSDVFAENFNNERQNQLRAQFFAPTLAEQDYSDIGKLAAVGAQNEALSADQLADQISRFNFAQEEPYTRISRYMGLINGNYGGTQTANGTQYLQNSATGGGSMIGGALGGAKLAQTLFPDVGMGGLLGGAVLGGIFG